jgi:hypothetical protein
MKVKIKKILLDLLTFVSIFSIGNLAFAQTCPETTTVNGPTSITFVGGVVDLGGDTQAFVWFEYGTSSGNYTFKTEKKIVTQLGKYCITVTNLQPCTTYYYRAAMENRAGPSYGAELSKTTFCVGQSTSSGQVLGEATQVSTGLIKTILSDYLLLPLLFSLFLVFVFKSHILRWEEWLEERKREYQKFKSEKLLKWKIAKIKLKEKKEK